VWRARTGGLDYVVRDAEENELPKDSAAWKLSGGAFTSAGLYAPGERLWLLDVGFERQRQPPRPDGRTASGGLKRSL
jgi:hypothetical protein